MEILDKPEQATDNDVDKLNPESPSTAIEKPAGNDETVDSPNIMQEDETAAVAPDVLETPYVAPLDESDLFEITLPGTSQMSPVKKPKFTGFHTEITDLDVELDAADTVPNQKKAVPLGGAAPRLSGWEGMVIDLETNEVRAKEKTGAQMLFERFLKTAGKGQPKAECAEIRCANKYT